jgi:hypothetical protein
MSCAKCQRPIDEAAHSLKRRLHDKLQPDKPFTESKTCSLCLWHALVDFAFGPSPELDELEQPFPLERRR